MQFKIDNSETNGGDIVSAINFFCDSNSTSYAIADKVRNANAGYEILIGKILGADGTWQWDDDSNYSNLPRGTFTLVEGQESYTFASTYLEIEHIDVLTLTAGVWRRLKPIDREELGGLTTEEYFGVDSGSPRKGFPLYYDKQGNSFRIFPAATSTAVTLASGGRVTFKRTASLFTTTSTTQSPGIPSPYHILLAYYAAIQFCAIYKPERVAWLKSQWDEGIKDMIDFYGRREKDKRKIMTMNTVNYI